MCGERIVRDRQRLTPAEVTEGNQAAFTARVNEHLGIGACFARTWDERGLTVKLHLLASQLVRIDQKFNTDSLLGPPHDSTAATNAPVVFEQEGELFRHVVWTCDCKACSVVRYVRHHAFAYRRLITAAYPCGAMHWLARTLAQLDARTTGSN